VEIPENGYIKICNDPESSVIVNIINSVDILMSLGKLAKKINNYDVNADAFSEALTAKLVEEKVFATLIKDGSKLQENLWKGVSKEIFFSSDSLGDFSNTVAQNLTELDFGELISDTAIDFGWDVGEEVFKYFTGPIKMVFDGMFALGKLQNVILQHVELVGSSGVGAIYIQNQGGGIRSVQQITVKSDTDLSDDTSLNVFQVTPDSTVLDILKKTNPDLYDAIIDGTSYTYNISMLKNGEEIQPDSEVEVYVPIPDNLKLLAYVGKAKIYRVEEDGTLTEMDTTIKDNCFVFNTSHFSLYTLVGNTALLNKVSFLLIISIVGISIFLFLSILLKKAKNKKTT
jgi:hypothetical protein